MSGGEFTVRAPHICGEEIEVRVAWWYSSGSYVHPPDGDEEWKHPERCPKCGVNLYHDEIFMDTVLGIIKETPGLYEESEYYPGDEVDYVPPEER